MLLCITNNSIKYQSFVYTQLNDQTILFPTIQFFLYSQFNVGTVLFLTIQFNMSTQFKCQTSIWPIDSTLSDATTPGQSGPGSNGNKRVLHVSQSSSITEASPSDWLVWHQGHSEESYPLVEMQLVYCGDPAN